MVNIHEAKTHLSRLIERVEAGEDILIARAGHPVARLTTVSGLRRPRVGGFWRGQLEIPDDDWEAPLPEDIQGAFDGKEP